jgi:aspartate kinase
MLNADPRKFQNTIKLNQISYREAIELAYYGASVIHPKTVKPLQNKKIPLYIKSFIDPGEEGTVITDGVDMIPLVPSFISKREQILVSFTPRDFSFIGEKELSEIFKVLSDHNIAVNLMQNSAISFSIVFNHARQDLENIRQSLDLKFSIRFNKGLELLTIRHYNEAIIKELTNGRNLLLEQRSRNTVRLIMDT